MPEKIYLTSPMPPSVNHYTAIRAITKNGKPMAILYETSEAKKYKEDFSKYVVEELRKQNWNFPVNKTQHFYVDCVFYFDRIDRDPNNYFKCMLDAITETQNIWVDDNVVCERVNRIYYDAKEPRIEMAIYPVEYIGIFDNQEELKSFEERCSTCKRCNNNCSIHKKAIEGRIQDEIINGVCSKYKKVV